MVSKHLAAMPSRLEYCFHEVLEAEAINDRLRRCRRHLLWGTIHATTTLWDCHSFSNAPRLSSPLYFCHIASPFSPATGSDHTKRESINGITRTKFPVLSDSTNYAPIQYTHSAFDPARPIGCCHIHRRTSKPSYAQESVNAFTQTSLANRRITTQREAQQYHPA